MINKYGTGYRIAETAVTGLADIGVALCVAGICVPAGVAGYALLPGVLKGYKATKYVVAAGTGLAAGAITREVCENVVEPNTRKYVSETVDRVNYTETRIKSKLTRVENKKGSCTKTR